MIEGESLDLNVYNTSMNQDFSTNKANVVKVLAVIGFLSLIGLVGFASISLAPYATVALSRIMGAAVTLSSTFVPKEEMIISSDKTEVSSGESFRLSFKRTSETSGSYTLSYPCLEGFYLEAETVARGKETVFCNTPFSFVNIDNSLSLRAFSTKAPYVDMPITLFFTKNGSSKVTDSTLFTLTVSNKNIKSSTSNEETSVVAPKDTAPVKPTETVKTPGEKKEQVYPGTTGSALVVNDPNGKPDLKVVVLEVGTVDKVTGTFTATSTLRRSDRIGVRFSVENIGTKYSPEWRFNAFLPTYPAYTFNSDSQTTLTPGDRVEFTIGFDQAIEGNQTVKFDIDPQGAVPELLEDNNSATVAIKVL